MINYTSHFSTKKTNQSEPIPGENQVKNNAGGYVYDIGKWKQLDRFLVLGSAGGSYYTTERKMTIDNANCVIDCLNEDYTKAVDRIVEVSYSGIAPKNDPAVFALSIAASMSNVNCRKYALSKVNDVCRTATHLMQFAQNVDGLRGWGSSLRKSFGKWYNDKTPEKLAYQLVKYRNRNGWSHADILRKSSPKPKTEEHNSLFRWVVGADQGHRVVDRNGVKHEYNAYADLPQIIHDFEKLQHKNTSVGEAVKIIESNSSITHEMLKTEHLREPRIWQALLKSMPVTAMIRNLGRMTANGAVKSLSNEAKHIVNTLSNVDVLKKARVHPMQMLIALKTYSAGHGLKGNLSWSPISNIRDVLEDGFYNTFQNVEPTGQNWYLAVDISGSMSSSVSCAPHLSCREVAAAMALVTANVERNYEIVGFNNRLVDIKISPRMSLAKVTNAMNGWDGGSTDCSKPMSHALNKKLDVDNFCVYTDNETWHGKTHPSQAMRNYRQKMNKPDSKLIVVGLTATNFSIADPNDKGMLDVVGCDASMPRIISEFAKGNI